ncbi:MAG: hypothetical protein FRX49_00189 [Trebouxia sp. A1-2]|nr:MAG: hypothetical protein FRX49_00189 [Trebouxia sp. A1-2]
MQLTRAAVTVIGMRLTILPCGTPLEGLGGALQLVAPLAQGILAVVDPAFHMWRPSTKISKREGADRKGIKGARVARGGQQAVPDEELLLLPNCDQQIDCCCAGLGGRSSTPRCTSFVGADLREVDKVGQDSRVMDVQISLQLIPDGLAQQLHVVAGKKERWARCQTSVDGGISTVDQSLIPAAGGHFEPVSQPLLVSRLQHIPQDVAQLHCWQQGRSRLLSSGHPSIQQAAGGILLQGVRADLQALTGATPTRLGLEAGEGHTSEPSVLHPAPHHIPAVCKQALMEASSLKMLEMSAHSEGIRVKRQIHTKMSLSHLPRCNLLVALCLGHDSHSKIPGVASRLEEGVGRIVGVPAVAVAWGQGQPVAGWDVKLAFAYTQRGKVRESTEQSVQRGHTRGTGRMQADVELVSSARHFAKEALQGAHLLLLEGLVQVAADQPDSAGLDDGPPRNDLHLLHALLWSVLRRHND